MHRKLKLEAAARHLQTAFETSPGTLSYHQALNLLSELEGFEGYRQVRALLGEAALKGEPTPKAGVPRQTLAMLLYGHQGYEGRKALPNGGCPVEGIKPVEMTYNGASSIAPSAHRLWVEDLEALMIAADWDAGERHHSALHDEDVLAQYIGVTGSHKLTWKQVREAQHVEGAIWSIDGVQYEFLQYIPIGPKPFTPYEAKDGEFMSREEYIGLQNRLESLDMAFAMGQDLDGHFEEREQVIARMDASQWTIHMDKGIVVHKSEYPEPEATRSRLSADVTLLDGTKTKWNFTHNISDREGELNDYNWEKKVEGHILEEDEQLLERLRDQMVEEDTFIVARDGKLGIVIEIEYMSLESDGGEAEDADNSDLRPYDEMVRQILRDHFPLQAQYPNVRFCVPDAGEVCNDRPAVWAFFEEGALTKAQRSALHEAMVGFAYGHKAV